MSHLLRCSDVLAEPLPGTAKTVGTCVALEYPETWSRDVLDGGTFGAELTGRIEAHLERYDAGLQLIRRVGRAGHGGQASDGTASFHLYLFFTREQVVELLKVPGPEALLEVDLSGPGRNGAMVVEHPVLLVCTHSRRDACCAIKGRPLAARLDEGQPREWVWESSHTKGHRFAPSMLLFPWGYSFGRMAVPAAEAMMAAAARGELFVPGNRGRGTLDAAGQVAELAVGGVLADAAEYAPAGRLAVGAVPGGCAGARRERRERREQRERRLVRHPDGRCWLVELVEEEHPGVVSSCGDEPKTTCGWRAVAVTPQEGSAA